MHQNGAAQARETFLSPPGRDEYFLVNLGSMSAQESTHRAICITKTSFCALLAKVFFPLWSKVLIRGLRSLYDHIKILYDQGG
jgi:hypothetical protein